MSEDVFILLLSTGWWFGSVIVGDFKGFLHCSTDSQGCYCKTQYHPDAGSIGLGRSSFLCISKCHSVPYVSKCADSLSHVWHKLRVYVLHLWKTDLQYFLGFPPFFFNVFRNCLYSDVETQASGLLLCFSCLPSHCLFVCDLRKCL